MTAPAVERRRRPDPRIREEVETCIRRERRRQLMRIMAVMAIVVSVWVTSFQGRAALVTYQRIGCERGKLDRAANAEGWRAAERARRSSANGEAGRRKADDLVAAANYKRIASGLERRARIDCVKEYPDPGPFAFGGGR